MPWIKWLNVIAPKLNGGLGTGSLKAANLLSFLVGGGELVAGNISSKLGWKYTIWAFISLKLLVVRNEVLVIDVEVTMITFNGYGIGVDPSEVEGRWQNSTSLWNYFVTIDKCWLLTRWSSLIPSKVLIFVWRAERNCIPTRVELDLKDGCCCPKHKQYDYQYEKKIKFVEQPIGPAPDPETTDPNTIDKYYETINLEQEVACLLLSSMSLDLQRTLEKYNTFDMMKELKTMFEEEAKQELFEIVKAFHTCKHKDGQSVSSYLLNMKSYVVTLERLGYAMPN
ncbi:hypothetical protein Tco_1344042 [Tanacetum coccineum]